jgi:hypothetical protein
MMYLRAIMASADNEIVERFKGGFVGRFMGHCDSICSPYSRLFGRRITTDDETQFSIQFSDRYEARTNSDPFYPLPITWPFDFARYISVDDATKRIDLLNAVHEACCWSARRMKWQQKPFTDAYESLLAVGGRWTYESKKPLGSPDKSCRVQLAMHIDLEYVDLTAIILPLRSRKVLFRVEIGRIRANQGCFAAGVFPDVKWVSESQFRVAGYLVDIRSGISQLEQRHRWWVDGPTEQA